jgi:hypothetical protein
MASAMATGMGPGKEQAMETEMVQVKERVQVRHRPQSDLPESPELMISLQFSFS